MGSHSSKGQPLLSAAELRAQNAPSPKYTQKLIGKFRRQIRMAGPGANYAGITSRYNKDTLKKYVIPSLKKYFGELGYEVRLMSNVFHQSLIVVKW